MHIRDKCTTRFRILLRFIQSRTRFMACCGPLGETSLVQVALVSFVSLTVYQLTHYPGMG